MKPQLSNIERLFQVTTILMKYSTQYDIKPCGDYYGVYFCGIEEGRLLIQDLNDLVKLGCEWDEPEKALLFKN